MKIFEEKDGARERKVLIALLTSEEVVGRVAPKWSGRMFKSKMANLVGGWAVEHHRKYGKAMGKAVEATFEEWASRTRDEATSEMVDSFLSSLSGEYRRHAKEINPQHMVDVAARHFRKVKLEALKSALTDDLEVDEVDRAEEKLAKYHRLELGSGSLSSPYTDKDKVVSYFAKSQEPIVTFPGDLGLFFGNTLKRGGFIAFLGPEKSSKSFWLQEIAFRAVKQRRRVAFFETGDQTEEEIGLRLMCRVAAHPLDSPTNKWPCVVKYPTAITLEDENGVADVEFEDRPFEGPLNANIAWDACERFMKDVVRSKDSYFRIACHPNSTIDIEGIETALDEMEREDWSPDVVVIDYADILAASPETKKKEERDQINDVWKKMRRLSQKRKCLLVTATQSDAEGYEKRTLTRKNFSGDKRKQGHATGLVGLNMTAEEKERGIVRLNWIVRRRGCVNSHCHVAGCLALANPAVRSTFGKRDKK